MPESMRCRPIVSMSILALPFPIVDPVLVEIGPLAIRWYAIAYIIGLIVGWRYVRRLVATPAVWGETGDTNRPSTDNVDDFLLWVTFGIIIGGRIGYVVFYNPSYFLENPDQILAIWTGGMSFHGGLLGAIVAALAFSVRRGVSALSLLDLIAAAAPIGLFFGRIANFVNAELWGRPATVPWAVVFPNAGPEPRHPSQLYEAVLEGLVLFLVLRVLIMRYGALRRPGFVGGAFLAGYAMARSVCEIFREPDAHIGFLLPQVTMGMALSLPMGIVGILAMLWAWRRAATQRHP